MSAAPFVFDFELEGKSIATDDDGGLIVAGIASDYSPDRDDEYVERAALEAALAKYLATNPVVLWQHQWDKPVGRTVAAHIDDDGLHVRVKLDPATSPESWQADLLAKVRSSTVRAFSIGGRFFRDRPGVVTGVDLLEISVAAVGKNANALFSVVAGKAFASTATDDDDLRQVLDDLARIKRDAVALTTTKAVGDNMNREALASWYAGTTKALPREAEFTADERAKIHDLAVRDELHRRDGVSAPVTISFADALGTKARNARGEVVMDEDSREAIRSRSDEDVPETISGEHLNTLLGVLPVIDPGPSPEDIFRADAEKQKRAQWAEDVREKFADVLKRKEQAGG